MQPAKRPKPGAERKAAAAAQHAIELHAAITSGDMERVQEAQRNLTALGFGPAAPAPEATPAEPQEND